MEDSSNLIESLKAKESHLLKHRQVLLNAAHFLRLYNQSSSNAIDGLTKPTSLKENISPVSTQDDTTEILEKHGLRLLWDALHNSEFLRSILILKYFKSRNILKTESLKYFEDQFIKIVYRKVLNGVEGGADVVMSCLTLENGGNLFLEHFKKNLNDFNPVLPALSQFCLALKTLKNMQFDMNLFIEKDSNFCEFPQLKSFKTDFSFNSVDLEFFTNEFKQILTEKLLKSFENGQFVLGVNFEVIEELGLDEGVLKTIKTKFNEFKIQGASEKLKVQIFDLFDKLMKSIQSSIRSNDLKIDETLLSRKNSVYNLLKDSNDTGLDSSLQLQLFQSLKNKSNIIFTIHRNELASLKGCSKLYLAISFIRDLFGNDETCLDTLISDLKKLFMDAFISDLQKSFTQLHSEHNEFVALCWLSAHFSDLNVTYSDAEFILNSFGWNVEEIKCKYSNQAALLSGLYESEKGHVSEIISTKPKPKPIQLLPHFTAP